MDLDFIIVGQGLAGSILAWKLSNRGFRVRIFDDGNNHASSAAAGLFNPVTGKRWVKTWKADELFPSLDIFYRTVQEYFKREFYFPGPVYRPFGNQREQNEWAAKSIRELNSNFADRIITEPILPGIIPNRFGGIILKGGYIKVSLLMKMMNEYFRRKNMFIPEKLEEGKLMIDKDKVRYEGMAARRIILCTGISAASGNFFSDLPFNPVKGEILTFKMDKSLPFILSRGIFIIPEKNGKYIAGATYDRGNTDRGITMEGRNELYKKLKKVIYAEVTVTGQTAGIRPATHDRRPFIGFHPEYKTVGIFNGFGSKGVSLIPYLADIFIDHILNGTILESEINIMRYFN